MSRSPSAAIGEILAKKTNVLLDPPVLQPAGLYLELAGEDIRKRAFMIDDRSGEELCLRPDMTAPAVRAALALDLWRAPFSVRYEGLVFRRQTEAAAGAAEFVQAGAEWFAPIERAASDDAEILATAIECCRAAGVEPHLRVSHVALFGALADSVGLPPAWAARLTRAFGRAGGVAALLDEAAAPSAPASPLAQALANLPADQAAGALEDVLAVAGIAPIGGRSVAEIAERLQAQARLAASKRPQPPQLARIREALAIEDAPDAAFEKLERVVRKPGMAEATPLEIAMDAFRTQVWFKLADRIAPPAHTRFSIGAGRGISYYDGLVFDLEAPQLGARASLGGGGRYDGLLASLAARAGKADMVRNWGAAGFALRPKRLADAAR